MSIHIEALSVRDHCFFYTEHLSHGTTIRVGSLVGEGPLETPVSYPTALAAAVS